ncbi:MAG: molybdopterin-dependent oxidoreductase [Sphingomonadaceae bacterium]
MATAVTTHRSFCRFCHANCAMLVDVAGDRVVAVRGDPDDPVYGGYTCQKGRQLAVAHNHPTRLLAPLRRNGDGFGEARLDDALDDIAAGLKTILERDGPHAIAVYCGTYAFQNSAGLGAALGFVHGIGTRNFYTSVTLDQPAKVYTTQRMGSWAGGHHGFTGADTALFVGNNPLVSHYAPPGGVPPFSPSRRLRDALDAGLKLVVIDPRETEVARLATLHLQPKPGEDASLLAAIAHVMLAEGLYDQAFCQQHVADLSAFRAAVAPFTPDVASARAGVPAEAIVRAARIFGAGTRGCATTGTGPEMAGEGTLVAWLVAALNIIGGRVNREGEVSPIPRVFTPNQPPRRAEVAAPVRPWGEGFPASRLRGLTQLGFEMPCNVLADEILTPGDGQVKALINVGGNPMVAFPNPDKMARALDSLELLVSIDIRISQTGRRSHWIVPGAMCFERDDITNLSEWWFEEAYARYARALVPRPGEVIDEWDFFREICRRMEVPMVTPAGPVPVDEPVSKTRFLDMMSHGCRVPPSQVRADTPDGRPIIYQQLQQTVAPGDPDNPHRFDLVPDTVAAELHAVLDRDDPDLPFRLTSRRSPHVYNSSGHQYEALATKGRTNPAFLHPDDMAALGLADGALVTITGKRGSLRAIAQSDSSVRRGVVSMSHAFGDVGEAGANVAQVGATTARLVDETVDFDPITGQSRQSAIPVRVEAA